MLIISKPLAKTEMNPTYVISYIFANKYVYPVVVPPKYQYNIKLTYVGMYVLLLLYSVRSSFFYNAQIDSFRNQKVKASYNIGTSGVSEREESSIEPRLV